VAEGSKEDTAEEGLHLLCLTKSKVGINVAGELCRC